MERLVLAHTTNADTDKLNTLHRQQNPVSVEGAPESLHSQVGKASTHALAPSLQHCIM